MFYGLYNGLTMAKIRKSLEIIAVFCPRLLSISSKTEHIVLAAKRNNFIPLAGL
jgi:hypothetical protein